MLEQKRNSTNKIYSIHEPQGIISVKATITNNMSLVLRHGLQWPGTAVSWWERFSKNIYDGHTLPDTRTQTTELVGQRPPVAIGDRGYRGKRTIDGTTIEIPKNAGKRATTYQKEKARKGFRRRAGIEPLIGPLKSDYRLMRNYLKGSLGDSINRMLAATACNRKIAHVLNWRWSAVSFPQLSARNKSHANFRLIRLFCYETYL